MKSLIIGNGEVGAALHKILSAGHEVYSRDIENLNIEGVEVLHICFPYFEGFIQAVKKYKKKYKPKYTVIHSTVPVGTSKKCGAYHSPIRGVHPILDKGIKTFVKYLAPGSKEIKNYFEKCGIKIKENDSSDNTEAAKIFCTAYYGWNIVFEKEVHEFCKKNGLDFNMVYTDLNRTYNDGYKKLGMEHVTRPVLKHVPGGIGGHCVIPNLRFLDNDISRFILAENEKFKNEIPAPKIVFAKSLERKSAGLTKN